MKLVQKFTYQALTRNTAADGVRHYDCPVTGLPVPSVTTILSATGDKTGLMEWREFVGEKKANRVVEEAVVLGSLMHTHLENHILGQERPRGSLPIRLLAERMANTVIERGLPHVDEVWGVEANMFIPGLCAGTADLIGVYQGEPAIMDFKTAKKMKSKEQIDDYHAQVAAYAICHEEVYGCPINRAAIFMVDRELKFRTFELDEYDMKVWKEKFLQRVEDYFRSH